MEHLPMPNDTDSTPLRVVDVHFHVGLRGDKYPQYGHISDKMRDKRTDYDIFLLFAGIERGDDSDDKIVESTLETISTSEVDHVVCLALDHVYDADGSARADKSDFWVSNDFIPFLRERARELHGEAAAEKILFGASVHPYDREFEARVEQCVDAGAVLMKWLPSGQQFTLASPKVRSALEFLATAKRGRPLPLLLHTGVEYAVPTSDERTRSWDYLSWSTGDRIANFFRFGKKWFVPNIHEVIKTIYAGLEAGCQIIFAHCGLPYFAPKVLRFLEHDDLPIVRQFLHDSALGRTGPGRCYADLSACVTPFRKAYFDELERLPKGLMLFGSDYPTPFFEIFPDNDETRIHFKAVRNGDLKHVVVPRGNPIDVNHDQLRIAFKDHPMFTNFDKHLW